VVPQSCLDPSVRYVKFELSVVQKTLPRDFLKLNLMPFIIVKNNIISFIPYKSHSESTYKGPKMIEFYQVAMNFFIKHVMFKTKCLPSVVDLWERLELMQERKSQLPSQLPSFLHSKTLLEPMNNIFWSNWFTREILD
jgi:hypothetical protein